MNVLVTGANGQLGNELRVVTCGSVDKYVFTDVLDASEESIVMLRKLAGSCVDTSTVKLDITDLEAVRALVKAIVTILANPKTGIYHYSNEGVCSWFDFTKMIAEYSGHTECKVFPCHSEEFPSPVKRPSFSVLDKTKIKETFKLAIPYWTDSLRRCIANLL